MSGMGVLMWLEMGGAVTLIWGIVYWLAAGVFFRGALPGPRTPLVSAPPKVLPPAAQDGVWEQPVFQTPEGAGQQGDAKGGRPEPS